MKTTFTYYYPGGFKITFGEVQPKSWWNWLCLTYQVGFSVWIDWLTLAFFMLSNEPKWPSCRAISDRMTAELLAALEKYPGITTLSEKEPRNKEVRG